MGFQSLGKGNLTQFQKYHDGGLADYMLVPSYLIDLLPDSVSFDVGAKVQDLGNAVRVLKEAMLPYGSIVAITASTGTMGTACARIASMFGIRRLILVARNSEGLRAVQKLSSVPCSVISTAQIKEDSPPLPALIRAQAPDGVDAIIDFMAEGTDIYRIMGALAVGGTFVHMGASSEILPLPLIAMMVNCWKVVGTRNHSREDALLVLKWLKDGTLKADDLITHHFNLSDIEDVARIILERSVDIRMAVIHPR
jgi:threonine dehydrogenase-like Zn-dependent dehydrogenase